MFLRSYPSPPPGPCLRWGRCVWVGRPVVGSQRSNRPLLAMSVDEESGFTQHRLHPGRPEAEGHTGDAWPTELGTNQRGANQPCPSSNGMPYLRPLSQRSQSPRLLRLLRPLSRIRCTAFRDSIGRFSRSPYGVRIARSQTDLMPLLTGLPNNPTHYRNRDRTLSCR